MKIDSHLQVRVPMATQEMDVPATMAAAHAPNQRDPQIQAARAFRGEDAAATYVVIIVPFSGVTQMLAEAAARLDYYKNRLIPMLVTKARGELLAQSVSTKRGLDILTIKFRALSGAGVPVVKYMRVLSVGTAIYELFFTPKDGTGQNCVAQREQFFETLLITP
ncbi:hypothetical protein [Hymenobacter baengnokdamensis]|uniref:hypothetical protein n=1 Tax=Hymenobacter baengnokdamensis TaxID=2615203 RepID=UPI0012455CA8|nr:hypothetical protein [Hymenobacter baengnokdamensis]